VVVAAAVGAVVAVGLLTIRLIEFRRHLRNTLAAPAELGPPFRELYHGRRLLFHGRLIRARAREAGPHVVSLTGLDAAWLEELAKRGSPRTATLVLEHAPETNGFAVFLAALEHPRCAGVLSSWLEAHADEEPLRTIALSSRGEPFDGRAARELLGDMLDQVYEMAGDPEWQVRYVALKLLVTHDAERAARAAWEAFDDPASVVRRSVAQEFRPNEAAAEQALYEKLYALLLDDPVLEVRSAARERIEQDFSSRYAVRLESLDESQALHVLEQLRPGLSEDINVAVQVLEGDNVENRWPAARFLDSTGVLAEMLRSITVVDRAAYDRSLRILANALSVHATGFLQEVRQLDSPAPLAAAAHLLRGEGDRRLITGVARRAFSHGPTAPGNLYQTALDTAASRGDDEAMQAVAAELHVRRADAATSELLLGVLPVRGEHVFVPVLFDCLTDATYPHREALIQAILRFPVGRVAPRLIEIVRGGPTRHSRTVRTDALRILGELGLEYTLQFVLESLAVLPLGEARSFARLLEKYNPDHFRHLATGLLESVDGSTRASLIACLPVTGDESFLTQVRAGLDDPDPAVRIACLWALVEYGDSRSLSKAQDRLRDPVPAVRREAGRALGAHGSEAAQRRLGDVLTDPTETLGVRRAAVEGLGNSSSLQSLHLLIDRLATEEELVLDVTKALAGRRARRDVKALVERFRDADSELRERLGEVFRRIGPLGEETLLGLLAEENAALRPHLERVLELTGLVETSIRKLSHRDPAVRREAAAVLARTGTVSAFRGIVTAARDPDPDVRVMVTKALERLAEPAGEPILHQLEQDPDRRIRRYTAWAVERLAAKSGS
jgi:HEAT repeat protein